MQTGDNSTLNLPIGTTRPQPDALLRIVTGGAASATEMGYVQGSPEFVGEITASSASYDLHDKFRAYERNGVQEYLVWRVEDRAIDWFALSRGKYKRLSAGKDGILRSKVFPGLWLDVAALLDGDLRRVFEIAQQGVASPPHAAFVKRLQGHRKNK